jgi:hypothetical protein
MPRSKRDAAASPFQVPSSLEQSFRELSVAAHIGKTLVATLKEKGQLPVIQADQFEDRGV